MTSGALLLKPVRPSVPAWLHHAVFYQIYPQSFADSNGDGIGDLPGLIGRLDYLRDLGINALWLNPIHPSPFGDAGYDVSDYFAVAPRYGTLADVRRLFREAQRREMRVVLDLVAGHTSSAHPWFQASCSTSRNAYSDHYVWTDSVWAAFGQTDFIKGLSARDGGFLANFFHFQPALNYGYAPPDPQRPWQQDVHGPGPKAVVRELRRILDFWLRLGCDGFRVDMAASLIRGPQAARAIRDFWRQQRDWVANQWPQAVLVSEWGDPSAAIAAGFHIDFLLHFGKPAYRELCAPAFRRAAMKKSGRGYFDSSGRGDITKFLASYLAELRATRRHGYIALPTGNHDFSRFLNHRCEPELQVFIALLLTLPGVPFIYYGDEIGLRYRELPTKEGGYRRTGSRTPMQWTAGRNRGFSTAPANQLYLPVNRIPGCDVASQAGRKGSTLELVRTLLRLRRQFPALGNAGGLRVRHARTGAEPFVFERSAGRERVVVGINPFRRAAPFLSLAGAARLQPLCTIRANTTDEGLELGPFALGVWLVPSAARR